MMNMRDEWHPMAYSSSTSQCPHDNNDHFETMVVMIMVIIILALIIIPIRFVPGCRATQLSGIYSTL